MGLYQKIAIQLGKPTGWFGKILAVAITKGNAPLQDWAIAQLDVGEDHLVLEIGFGSGRTLQKVAALAKRGVVFGIEYSPTMVELASKNNQTAIQAGRIKIQEGDVSNLPYEDEQFDKVISIHTLYFWPDPVQGLKQIGRVLKKDGVLVLAIEPKEIMLRRKHTQQPTFSHYDQDKIVEMFAEAGFSDVSIRPQPGATGLCLVGRKRPSPL